MACTQPFYTQCLPICQLLFYYPCEIFFIQGYKKENFAREQVRNVLTRDLGCKLIPMECRNSLNFTDFTVY